MDEDFSYQAGDTISDELGNNYIYTGSDWQQYDTSGGMDSGITPSGGSSSVAIPDGGVDAQGNPTYVNEAGAPVTASGVLIPSANARTALEGGGFKTINPNGSVTYEDPDGGVYTVNADGTYTTTGGTYDPKTGSFVGAEGTSGGVSSLLNSVKSLFKKPDGSYDWAKIAGVGASMYGMFGGDKPKTGGWQGSIPQYTATRQQVNYNDPNRRPGSQGRQYFTDVQYGAEGAAPAAQMAANTQGQGILSGYTPAAAPTNKWAAGSATPAVATPWAKPPVKAATGRYLRGPTDGMADEINTSIDNKQPAKLSHGEFVVPADVVSHLGNGNSDAGAKKLYSMMDKVRQARTGTKKQGKRINPDKYIPGGAVNKYAKGGIAELPVKKFAGTTGSVVPAADTTTSSSLSPWAGDYVSGMLGKGQALTNAPYQAYTGPLTAGPSDLQSQAFAGASNIASTGYTPTTFTAGTFGTDQAKQYMNPYLQSALEPQLAEMRRQAQINLQPQMAQLTKAGGFGGGRQAIMESEANRNLLAEQNKTVGQGYATAYDKAMQQFNADQQRQMEAQKASEQSGQYSADYGLKSLQELEKAGQTQRGIEAEGIAADKAQFEEQRDWPYKMVQYQQGLLQGLPISTQTNTQNMSGLTSLLANAGYGGRLMDLINQFSGTPTTTPAATSPGVTATKSAGVTS